MPDLAAPSDAQPYFSVLITAFDRAGQIGRCVRSAVAQTHDNFEVVVVDDGSTDATVAVLEAFAERRLRVVRHHSNRGTSSARATAVDHARGQWIVMLDSDDELLPHALVRLEELIDDLDPGVRVIRFRYRLDDGTISPGRAPLGVTDYHARLAWLDSVVREPTGTDAGHCMQRSVLQAHNYFRGRRGAVEGLWELNLARHEPSLWVEDILGLVHVDAPNRYSRHEGGAALISRFLNDAPDQLWMAETTLAEHGPELARLAPNYRRRMLEDASREALLAGHRLAGSRHGVEALRAGASAPRTLVTLVAGLIGPRALATAKVASRRRRAWRGGDVTAMRRGA